MGDLTKDVRETNDNLASGMIGTGFELFVVGILLGGSAFFLQWALWFIVIGWAVHSIVRKGADAADWVTDKIPANPFRRSDTTEAKP